MSHSMKIMLIRIIFVFVLAGLVACDSNTGVHVFKRGEFPEKLSAWGLVKVDGRVLQINQTTIAYDLNTPLFTDYAHKLRTVWVPGNRQINYSAEDDLDLPVGSVVSKTFFYPIDAGYVVKTVDETRDFTDAGLNLDNVRLIETRLMVRLKSGWQGLPYVWDQDQKEAYLEITGASIDLTTNVAGVSKSFTYIVPDFNQCQGCHIENLNTKEMRLLGFKARHIDKQYSHFGQAGNQLENLVLQGKLEKVPSGFTANAVWSTTAELDSDELTSLARTYLDINCGHCHNPHGAADTSGLFLNRAETNHLKLGMCKPPVAAGQGTGGRPVGIMPGHAEDSILVYRMQSLDLGAMMPELGRSLVHEEGVSLISRWINDLKSEC